jgi:hypothetical protein
VLGLSSTPDVEHRSSLKSLATFLSVDLVCSRFQFGGKPIEFATDLEAFASTVPNRLFSLADLAAGPCSGQDP